MVKLLIFGRALYPDSKYATFVNRDRFLFPVTNSESVNDVYYALDALNEKAETIQKRMNLKIRESIGRNTEVCFYDVTNYYFEIGENDPDGGLRKKGVSKEKRGEPIVQMGLFIDDNGIPIAYKLFPGNHIDATTLRPAMKKTIDNMDFGRVIIVADGGLNSGPNIAHILNGGNGYIVSKSTKKSGKTTKAWILDQEGYRINDAGTFKVKSKIRTRTIKAEDGSSLEIKEKLVCFWSKRYYERERHENEKFIEYLDSVISNPDKLKDKQSKIAKFLKKMDIDKATGEVVKTATALSIDMDKIRQYLDLMGYYTIMTSEINKPDEEIISKYHGLSRIEDSFRITKSDLEGRPVFVRTPEHINAHFLTCFIALVMLRLIQHKILTCFQKTTNSTEHWESGLSAHRIQAALNGCNADPLPGGYFRMTKPSKDMCMISEAFGFDADLIFPTKSDLHKLKAFLDTAAMC
jgi:transposase